MIPAITFRLTGVEAETERLGEAVEDQLTTAATMIALRAAAEARGDHPYQNRTGLLESSTQAVDAAGSALDGTLRSGVLADTDYAEVVNGRPEFEFLQPAFDRIEHDADRMLDDALTRAARQAGW